MAFAVLAPSTYSFSFASSNLFSVADIVSYICAYVNTKFRVSRFFSVSGVALNWKQFKWNDEFSLRDAVEFRRRHSWLFGVYISHWRWWQTRQAFAPIYYFQYHITRYSRQNYFQNRFFCTFFRVVKLQGRNFRRRDVCMIKNEGS